VLRAEVAQGEGRRRLVDHEDSPVLLLPFAVGGRGVAWLAVAVPAFVLFLVGHRQGLAQSPPLSPSPSRPRSRTVKSAPSTGR